MLSVAALAGHRRRLVRQMTSRVIVEIPGTGEAVWNPETETMDPPLPTILYEGPATVQAAGANGRVVDAAGQQVLLHGYEVHLPGDLTTSFPVEARLIVTEAKLLPALVGTSLRIVESPLTDSQTTRRLFCELAA